MSELEQNLGRTAVPLLQKDNTRSALRSERLSSISNQDFQQALDLFTQLSYPFSIRDAGRPLALNLWAAGIDESPVVNKMIQTISKGDYSAYHRMAGVFMDIGKFDQMYRMLVASRTAPSFFENFWLDAARKKHEFGQDPKPELDRVRDYIEMAGKYYCKYRGYADLAKAVYDLSGQPQDELLELVRNDWTQTIDKRYAKDQATPSMVRHIAENESSYFQELYSTGLLDVAVAHAHCGDYKRTMEFYDMINPEAVRKDNERLIGEVSYVKRLILYHLIETCFRNGDYSEGFKYADQWFLGNKKAASEFETNTYTILVRLSLGEALYHEGKPTEGNVVLSRALKGVTSYEGGISCRLSLVDKYQQTLKKVGRRPTPAPYQLTITELDSMSSDLEMRPIEYGDIGSPEADGQLDLRMRIDGYMDVAKGYAKIGRFEEAKEALARVEQFGDADDEVKEGKIKTLSFIACQEKRATFQDKTDK